MAHQIITRRASSAALQKPSTHHHHINPTLQAVVAATLINPASPPSDSLTAGTAAQPDTLGGTARVRVVPEQGAHSLPPPPQPPPFSPPNPLQWAFWREKRGQPYQRSLKTSCS